MSPLDVYFGFRVQGANKRLELVSLPLQEHDEHRLPKKVPPTYHLDYVLTLLKLSFWMTGFAVTSLRALHQPRWV